MKYYLAISCCCLISFAAFSQNNDPYSYTSHDLKVKPAPTQEFIDWLASNNEKLGKAAPYSSKKTTKVTLFFLIDEKGNILNPMVWRGIGQGYDEYAQKLIKENPYNWTSGHLADGKAVKTEVYYQLDYMKNENSIVSEDNVPID